MVKDGGFATSYDAITGATHYEQQRLEIPGSFYHSPVAANGHIYLLNLAGKAATLAAGPKPEVRWRTWPAPRPGVGARRPRTYRPREVQLLS